MINIILKEDNNFSDWDDLIGKSRVSTFFQSTAWVNIWLKHFGGEPIIYYIYENNNLIGIAPLIRRNDKINLLGMTPVLGGELVSDHGDIIANSFSENLVWKEVLTKVKADNPKLRIILDFIRNDSPSFAVLKELGGKQEQVDVSPIIDLPQTWEEYLAALDRHNRHELKRKIRRLEEEEIVKSCFLGDDREITEFFRLMALSNEQKRYFLSLEMKSFFENIIITFTKREELELSFLKKRDIYIAAVMVFYYNNHALLYNSGFDPTYSYLSPGLTLKAYMIKSAIETKKSHFDFLRGGEKYKFNLGAKERKLYRFTFGE
jgi:CelD/BcsL family acetyltransferase involved in cellulose biosynthesis